MPPPTTALVAASCLTLAAVTPARPSAGQASPQFQSGVEAVTVDVGVLGDHERPIDDLEAADFVVTVDGHPRRVVSATWVGAPRRSANEGGREPAESDAPPVSSNDAAGLGRLVVVVIDQDTLGPNEARVAADVARRLVDGLRSADRVALVLMPAGSGLWFTADHDRFRRATAEVTGRAGLAGFAAEPRGLALDELRAIASGDFVTLANVASRECGPQGLRGTSGDGALPGPGAGGSGAAAGARTGGDNTVGSGASAFDSADPCTRQIQSEARAAWQRLHSAARASLAGVGQALVGLEPLDADTAVVLVSGGWPLEFREKASILAPLAAEAAGARATIYTLFVPATEGSAERRMMVSPSIAATAVRRWPLDALAQMTGGSSYQIDAGSSTVLDRLSRELSGYYRLGIERDPEDVGGQARPMTVRVASAGVTVRAPAEFVAPRHDATDLRARLDAALRSPAVARGLGLRIASYVAPDPDDPARVKVMLVGAASRLRPGAATLHLLLRDPTGKEVASGRQPLGQAAGDPFLFTSSITVEPGAYTIRAAVIDEAGGVGSVDHQVVAEATGIGTLRAGGLWLARVPHRTDEAPHALLDSLRQDDQLALQLELEGDRDEVARSDVVFQIAGSAHGRALVTIEASRMSGTGPALAQAVTDLGTLPPGTYVARARVTTHAGGVGEVDRAFVVTAAPASVPGAGHIEPPAARSFALDQVLAPPLLGALLDQVAARSDAAGPSVGALLEHVRTLPASEITVPEAARSEAPAIARFVAGLARLARADVVPAAEAFRDALKIAPDLYPAIVYLGACYAAGGKDLEAAGAWQTALIREGDVVAIHVLLIDAFERLGQTDAALAAIARARRRWPDAPEFKRRFVMAALGAGRYAEGLAALDGLEPAAPEDEPALALGLQVLYRSIVAGTPIGGAAADRDRLLRYADRYRRLNGPSLALVNAWAAEVAGAP